MAPTFSPALSDRPLVLYDGLCGFCGRAIALIRANDRGRFRFAPLDSEEARRVLSAAGWDPAAEPSLVLADAEGVHTQSEAALRIGRSLRSPWPLAAALARLVPRAVRDAVYRRIARSRYRLPGRPNENGAL